MHGAALCASLGGLPLPLPPAADFDTGKAVFRLEQPGPAQADLQPVAPCTVFTDKASTRGAKEDLNEGKGATAAG